MSISNQRFHFHVMMNKGLSVPDLHKHIFNASQEKYFKSRYEEDFVEIEKLGRGGYGAVYKVQNKIDGLFYALKKIQFKNSSSQLLEKVLREVKTLALLHHPNIVRYHTAWMEEDDAVVSSSHPDLHDESSVKGRYSGDEYSEYSGSTEDSLEQFNPFKYEDSHDHATIHHRETHKQPTNPLKISYRNVPLPTNKRSSPTISRRSSSIVSITTLFIVMQLYSTTLSQFLDERPCVDPHQNIQIFRQICKGLQYIHSCGVIHRDLKPGNIFLSQTGNDYIVCLGDFGLAIHNGNTSPTQSPTPSPFFPSSLSPSPNSDGPTIIPASVVSMAVAASPLSLSAPSLLAEYSTSSILGRSWEAKKHTSAVGTLTYSSPEQRFKGVYNEKTDIFSLGIIFFELYYSCTTKMEKARVLADLRNRIIPPSFLQNYPAESAFILSLLLPNPDDRPSVDQILQHPLLVEEMVTVQRQHIVDLESTMQKQFDVIQQQQEQIRLLEQKLAMLGGAGLMRSSSPISTAM